MKRLLATAILLATAAGACSTPAARGGVLAELRAHDRAMHAWCAGGYAALEVHGQSTEIVAHCPGQEAPVRNR